MVEDYYVKWKRAPLWTEGERQESDPYLNWNDDQDPCPDRLVS